MTHCNARMHQVSACSHHECRRPSVDQALCPTGIANQPHNCAASTETCIRLPQCFASLTNRLEKGPRVGCYPVDEHTLHNTGHTECLMVKLKKTSHADAVRLEPEYARLSVESLQKLDSTDQTKLMRLKKLVKVHLGHTMYNVMGHNHNGFSQSSQLQCQDRQAPTCDELRHHATCALKHSNACNRIQ